MDFARKICTSPKDFILNLKQGCKIVSPPVPTLKPNTLASDFYNEAMPKAIDVFSKASHFMERELAMQPYVKRYFRDKFISNACITTEPTAKGIKELDATHPLYRAKRLQSMPISTCKDDIWYDIEEAERRELIKVEFGAGNMQKEREGDVSAHEKVIHGIVE